MAKHSSGGVFDLLGLPASFIAGLVAGVAMPLAGIAAMVAAVRLITGKVPFLSRVAQDEKGERQLVLGLVSPEQARALWAEHKQSFGAPLDKLRLEIQAMSEQAEPEDAPQS
jgi:hypothetical protein